MAFGLLTTRWRRLRTALNCSSPNNANIIRVCTKLDNFCIRMKQARGEGRFPTFEGDTVDPAAYGISPLDAGGSRKSKFGFLEPYPGGDLDFNYSSLTPCFSRRNSCLAEVQLQQLRRPQRNIVRNKPSNYII